MQPYLPHIISAVILIIIFFWFKTVKDRKDAAKTAKYTKQKNLSQAQYERSLMTPSLRYDILKRDGFRCTICGRSQDDGVKLHVDHIKPVSKGGKTEPNNLRTLCEDCNQGKKAKYDPHGLN